MCAERRALVKASGFAAAWAATYAVYRGYYAAGGTVGMLGTPVSDSEWRYINAIAALLLVVAAVLPLLLLEAWRTRRGRVVALVLCWVITVGCAGHAFVGIIQRVLSLSGVLTLSYPFWITIDRQEADWQALLWNEPWFLIEGLSWHAIAWTGRVREAAWRVYWNGSVLIAVCIFTVVGLLSTMGIIGRVIVG